MGSFNSTSSSALASSDYSFIRFRLILSTALNTFVINADARTGLGFSSFKRRIFGRETSFDLVHQNL